MSRPLVLRPDARAEFEHAALWYEDQRKGLGLEFVDEIEQVFETIAEQPDRFAPVDGDIREAPVSRFPYAIYYRARSERITIIAVFHCSRNPAIWKRRT